MDASTGTDVAELEERVKRIAADAELSGVVRIDVRGQPLVQQAFGLANRSTGIANAPNTLFGIASGTKGFTALVVMRLITRGQLSLDTTARSVLGDALPLIDDRVTVEQLLGHRSGIGDYFDEDEVDTGDFFLPVPVSELVTTEQYLQVLGGHPMKFSPGERFAYCNGGYVVLALIAERVAATPFHDLVDEFVCRPAGMSDTGFLRSDNLPERAALGYLDDDGRRTNELHLPVRGNGDGGIYTTAADVHAFWDGLFDGRILPMETVREMIRPRRPSPVDDLGYGLGFWLNEGIGAVSLHGFDAGVGFVSVRDRGRRFAYTVVSNTSRGAWQVSEQVGQLVVSLP